jgi:aspartyl protease family protein
MKLNPTFALLLVAVAITGLVLILNDRFPWVLADSDNSYHLVYLLLWLIISGSSVFYVIVHRPARALRDLTIWGAVFATLIVGYSYRDALQEAGRRVRGELMPGTGTANADGSRSFKAASDGHFYIEAAVEGTPVLFLVDTGATRVVLSPADAKRIGIDLTSLRYDSLVETANGMGRGASVRLRRIELGSLQLSDVAAEVNEAEMSQSLLGMSFLSRIGGYEVRNGELTLHP